LCKKLLFSVFLKNGLFSTRYNVRNPLFGLVYVRGIAPDATYQFKHALIRDAAYEALLKSRRRELHRQVAQTIDNEFPVLKEAHPEVLARHWIEAGETEPAIVEWSRAGKAAEERKASIEALENYQQALALLNLLPESRERDLRELGFRQSVVVALWYTKGTNAPEAVEAIECAAALAEKIGDLRQIVNLMTSRVISALTSGDPSADTLADRALELAVREGNFDSLGQLYAIQEILRQRRGDLTEAEKHFTTGIEYFDDPGFIQKFSHLAVLGFVCAMHNAWLLGRTDLARQRMARMMAAANQNRPFEVGVTQLQAGLLWARIRDYERAEALAAQCVEGADKLQSREASAISRCLLGLARAELGREAEGIALIRDGLTLMAEVGNHWSTRMVLTFLAAAQERVGAIADALETIEQALQANPDRLLELPETLRIRGKLRLKQGQAELAEADFREAIALAQKMGAKAWELRAIMSLARMLASKGHRDEAHSMLAEIYNWFTEGFDTADLKEAKALLDELAT
jgi:tetratricopeptide (TPR) repeat protein